MFVDYLKSDIPLIDKKALNSQTANSIAKNIRPIFKKLYLDEEIMINPFDGVSVPFKKAVKPRLTNDYYKNIVALDLANKPVLEVYRVHPNILNKKIKEICRIVNINSEVQITKTLGGKKETFKHKKYELITMHSLRRSFCTNAILKGASPHEVMFISGHTKTSTFNKYVKASKFEKAKSILESPMFS